MSILARRCLSMTAVAAIALAAMASEGMAQSAKLSAKAQNLTAIMSDVRANGRSRVIVEFAIADSNLSTKAALSARKASVRATQDAILASAFGSVAASSRADRALSRMKIEPMFAISANLAEIEKLAADSRVVHSLSQSSTPELKGAMTLSSRGSLPVLASVPIQAPSSAPAGEA
jgi:hypothetical protein